MISIIIPVYKAEDCLRNCLESILGQTVSDWECIIIDDGSPDKSLNICKEYIEKDARFRVLCKLNGGVSSARNLGLDNARGEWIVFVDADDRLMPTFLEGFNLYTTDFYIGGFKNFGENENITVPSFANKYYKGNEVGQALVDICMVPSILAPWGKVFKKSIIEDHMIRFPLGMRNSEDIHFVLEYFSFSKSVEVCNSFNYLYFCANEQSGKKYQMGAFDYKFHVSQILKQISKTESRLGITLPDLRQKLLFRFWYFFRTWLQQQNRFGKIKGIVQYAFCGLYKYATLRDVLCLYYMAIFPGIYKLNHKE